VRPYAGRPFLTYAKPDPLDGVRVEDPAGAGRSGRVDVHRHLGQHHDHRQAQLVQPLDELRLGVLEAAVHAPDAVPGDVQLVRERHLAHALHRGVEVGQDLLVVLAHLQPLGVHDAEVADLVEVEVAVPGHRLADPGPGHVLAEDGVDQGRLADTGLAEDDQVEPADVGGLLVELVPERLSEPISARHGSSLRGQLDQTPAVGQHHGVGPVPGA
jgi:hypothetical protein